ncbi:hypothetical protein MGG_17231 [Pyricularia oryzae 70-15]|uniref:Uncharacterized protein n=2 Tax=Pyricularia oryzae TaxID=318829 RepID=G4N914_PYRO7|nr:uncharacterized protein MGG_17231 [Pyricularia oryzae 70-15]EHA51109.1 hypothetical protein MGG_17231 [Pyricularia oryzae 70-15]
MVCLEAAITQRRQELGPMTAPPSQDHEVQSNGLEASCQYNDDLCSELHPFSSFPDFPSLRTTAYELGTTCPQPICWGHTSWCQTILFINAEYGFGEPQQTQERISGFLAVNLAHVQLPSARIRSERQIWAYRLLRLRGLKGSCGSQRTPNFQAALDSSVVQIQQPGDVIYNDTTTDPASENSEVAWSSSLVLIFPSDIWRSRTRDDLSHSVEKRVGALQG